MNDFDLKAQEWDKNPIHMERSIAIARGILDTIPLRQNMKAMEFGSGAAILSFLLKEYLSEIVSIDSSSEMINVTNGKIADTGATNMRTLFFDLEKNELKNEKVDIIFTQMALHHVADIETIIKRFNQLLKPSGYLAIADLYTEDGTFHDESFTGHKGFDVEELSKLLKKHHYSDIIHKKCYTIKRATENEQIKEFPVFLLTCKRD